MANDYIMPDVSNDWIQVKIGPLLLGERARADDIQSENYVQPNPVEYHWVKDWVIVEEPILGDKPTTENTTPKALEGFNVKFRTTNIRIRDLIMEMEAGPYLVVTAEKRCCMYMKHRDLGAKGGYKDKYRDIVLELKEAND